jgi:hypothetical protein
MNTVCKITTYLFLLGSAIFHLAPDDTTWVVVLYYVINYSLILMLLAFLVKPIKLNKYDKIEIGVFSLYMIGKMIYHIAKVDKEWAVYLKEDLNSEFWSGVFTFFILGIMLTTQSIYIISYVKKRKD